MAVFGGGKALLVAFVFMFAINGLSQVKGPGFAKSNAELSDLSPTYLTPDGPTFGIWPIIYLLEGIATVQEVVSTGPLNNAAVVRRRCLAAAFAANAAWLFLFTNELYGLSCIVITFYLAAMGKVYSLLNFSRDGGSPFALKAGVSVNVAWLCVATCINVLIATARNSAAVPAGAALAEPAGSQVGAAAVALALTALAGAALYTRGDAAFPTASAWALFGVRRAQAAQGADLIASTAGACSMVCALGAAGGILHYFLRGK
eukprot:TRINITY_DN99206_c0_g1_i1.p1 TRINITY_DN99206_c0_g1~~TRINITY_DN99206_c0_g1_i1.p1  ORF type:complete len:286 (-),score=54.78 TRINITY_DN99206_c0_g1_i1:155-934(-)